MNPYTLTLLRHGDIDHDGRLIGLTDLPLTELGQQQLEHSWKRISNLAPVTCIATSPLQRCREFAVKQALSGSLTLKVDPRFAEMDFGGWDGQPVADLEQAHPGWATRWPTAGSAHPAAKPSSSSAPARWPAWPTG
ncbi:Phosphoglyceromutase [Chromobacterium violaceum]|uniref:Phosphoglyceromutase n=1 Tax=Chromobacterium violaceum TaxID=536 RepID=A0A447T5X0_CHRVL|nr:Phosphoglyceromutase [Chromobacterium violaceum]